MPFTKLDSRLVFSSLMREDAETFRVFVVLLSLCGSDGIAPVSKDFLQAITKQPSDVIKKCLLRLSSPDPTSRTPDNEGRRIRKVVGGYLILNYWHYRGTSHKEGEAERKRLARAAKGKTSGLRPDCSASASSSASTSASKKGGAGGEKAATTKRFRPPTVEEVAVYCEERNNGIDAEQFVDHYESNGWRVGGKAPMKNWQAAVRTWERRLKHDEGSGDLFIHYRKRDGSDAQS